MSDDEIAAIRLPLDELSAYVFVDPADAPGLVLERSAAGLARVLAQGPAEMAYVEDGIPR